MLGFVSGMAGTWLAALCLNLVPPILTVIIGYFGIKILMGLFEKLLRRSPLDATAIPFVVSVVRIFLYVLLGISVATSLKLVEASSIVTALGAVGLAVSLAVKDSLSNLMGGMMLIVMKTFSKGDYVELESVSGTVAEIGLIYTTLITVDNKRISIPNGQVTNAKIINYSCENSRRVDVSLTISRDSDLELARKVMLEVATAHPMALKDPAPSVVPEDFTDLGIRLTCRAWATQENYWNLRYELLNQLDKKLKAAGIVIPVVQVLAK